MRLQCSPSTLPFDPTAKEIIFLSSIRLVLSFIDVVLFLLQSNNEQNLDQISLSKITKKLAMVESSISFSVIISDILPLFSTNRLLILFLKRFVIASDMFSYLYIVIGFFIRSFTRAIPKSSLFHNKDPIVIINFEIQ